LRLFSLLRVLVATELLPSGVKSDDVCLCTNTSYRRTAMSTFKLDQSLLKWLSLVPRADWEDATDYPATASPTAWAWEFLRRSFAYQQSYERVLTLKRAEADAKDCAPGSTQLAEAQAYVGDTSTAIALGWGLRQMHDPAVAVIDDDAFLLLNVPDFIRPSFDDSDLRVGLLNTGSLRMVKECVMNVRSDQLLVRWNLEGDDTAQIAHLKGLLKLIKGANGRPTKRSVEVETYGLSVNGDGDQSFVAAVVDRAVPPTSFKVNYSHCGAALRCLDAYATLALDNDGEPLSGEELKRFASDMAVLLGAEQHKSNGHADPRDWDPSKVLASLNLGLEYTLNGRYLHLATPSR
jgi:hypothetical protein